MAYVAALSYYVVSLTHVFRDAGGGGPFQQRANCTVPTQKAAMGCQYDLSQCCVYFLFRVLGAALPDSTFGSFLR